MTDQELEELKAKHPTSKLFKVVIPATKYDDETAVVVKRPPKGEWKRFRTMLGDESQKVDAFETLTKSCVVHPDPAALNEMLKERPALAEMIGGNLAELAGLEGKAIAEKL